MKSARIEAVLLLFSILLIAGCGATASEPTPTASPRSPTATHHPTATRTPSPTLTRTPTATRTPTSTPGPGLDELIQTPAALVANANPDAAVEAYLALHDLYPDKAAPLLAVAVIARNTGDLDGAESYLWAAVQAEPDNLDALRQLALLLDQQQAYDDLVDVYGQMLTLTPEDADLYVARAMIHARLGDSESALTDLQAAQQIDPSRTYAFLNAAAAASGQRDYESATEIASAGLDSEPESVSLRLTRGLDWLALGDLEAALEDFNAVLELDDLNVGGYLWRGRTLMRLDRYEEALPDFKRAAELGVQSGVSNVNLGYEAMADAAEALAHTDPQAAFAYLAEQVFDFGSRDAIMLGYARVDFQRGSPDLALGRLNNLVDRDYVPALYWRALVLAEQGEQAAAVDDLNAYLEVRHSGPEAEWAYDLLSSLEED